MRVGIRKKTLLLDTHVTVDIFPRCQQKVLTCMTRWRKQSPALQDMSKRRGWYGGEIGQRKKREKTK